MPNKLNLISSFLVSLHRAIMETIAGGVCVFKQVTNRSGHSAEWKLPQACGNMLFPPHCFLKFRFMTDGQEKPGYDAVTEITPWYSSKLVLLSTDYFQNE